MIEVTSPASFVGTPLQVAGRIVEAVDQEAADGFILVPHVTPGGLDEFADTVVPILQEAGRFRHDYEGPTLRDHLGLRPARTSTHGLDDGVPHDGRPTSRSGSSTWSRWCRGPTPERALCNAVDLVQVAEELGYRRYWFAEHHLNPGVAGSAPALLIAMAGANTEHIRLGSGGVQSGHRTALSVVEEFGLLDAMYPGRIDLGIGRSGGRTFFKEKLDRPDRQAAAGEKPPRQDRYTDNGLLIPAAPSLRHLAAAPRISLTAQMLQQADAKSAEYGELVEDILGLLEGSYRSSDGLDPHPVPGTGAQVEPWMLGSSPGESAAVAGRLGLRFAASYHISPATALSAAHAYREAFVPSAELERPYVAVSADVVVGPDDETARTWRQDTRQWVRSIRCGEGAIPFPDPEEAGRTLGPPKMRRWCTIALPASSSARPRRWSTGSSVCKRQLRPTKSS